MKFRAKTKESKSTTEKMDARLIPRAFYYPNMPKWQPCPECNRGSRRASKTLGGARYNCSIHGIFFVRKG